MSVRLPELALVLALVACRGEEKPAPAARRLPSQPATGSASPRPRLPESAARTPEERQALEGALAGPESVFAGEPTDPTWSKSTREIIVGAAPWATVECRTRQCRVQFVAATSEDAMAKTDALRALKNEETEEDLAQWQPVPPIAQPDGRLEIRLYAHFTRQ